MSNFQIETKVINESGHESALLGISFNKNQPLSNMQGVANKLAPLDLGHNKFLEQIHIWCVVNAPRYFWQEADTFRLSSKSSQSTMHTILKNTLISENFECSDINVVQLALCNNLLNEGKLIELKRNLPEGFLQRRMWQFSYKTLRNIILQRRNHRLPHWKKFIADILSQLEHPELLPQLINKK